MIRATTPLRIVVDVMTSMRKTMTTIGLIVQAEENAPDHDHQGKAIEALEVTTAATAIALDRRHMSSRGVVHDLVIPKALIATCREARAELRILSQGTELLSVARQSVGRQRSRGRRRSPLRLTAIFQLPVSELERGPKNTRVRVVARVGSVHGNGAVRKPEAPAEAHDIEVGFLIFTTFLQAYYSCSRLQ